MPCSDMTRSLAVWFVLSAAAACASGGTRATPASDSTAAAPAPARRSASLITEEDIAKVSARDAHHAVQLLRPDWLRARGSATINGAPQTVVVYLNNQRYGGPETLKQFQAMAVKELRYMSASEATNRFGTGHNSGAILVRTK
jgi:hypothetical protein